MKIHIALVIALICLTLIRPHSAYAKNTLLDATDEICADVKKYLDQQGKNKVRIGQFTGRGPEALRASAQPLLKEAILLSLRKQKIEIVDAGVSFELSGTYQAIEDALTGRQAVILSVTLDDLQGNEIKLQGIANGKADRYLVENVPDVAKVLGINSYVPPGRTEKEQIKDIKRNVDHPECNFDGTRILAAKGAPFAIEILTAPERKGKRGANDYKVQSPTDQKGLAFVPIKRGEVYAVRMYNLSEYEVAVDLRIDGLSMYYFSEKRDKNNLPAYKYVIVGPNKSVEIRGWFVSLNDSDEFVVVPVKDSVIAKVTGGNPAEIGTITALFHRAWDRKQGRPNDEPANPSEYSLSADATGRGQRFQERYVEVDYAVGTHRGSVSVRYSK